MSRAKKWLFGLSFTLVALAVCMVALAQTTGYRFTQSGIVFAGNGTVCFESSYNAGPDVCIERSGTGHLSILGGGLTANPDITGTKTLAAGAATVTFVNAFTAAPLVFCTDQTAAAAVRCSASTTTLTIAGTGTDVIQYLVLGNPN